MVGETAAPAHRALAATTVVSATAIGGWHAAAAPGASATAARRLQAEEEARVAAAAEVQAASFFSGAGGPDGTSRTSGTTSDAVVTAPLRLRKNGRGGKGTKSLFSFKIGRGTAMDQHSTTALVTTQARGISILVTLRAAASDKIYMVLYVYIYIYIYMHI